MSVTNKIDSFRCTAGQCDAHFATITALHFHTRTMHGTVYRCRACDETFGCASDLSLHTRTAHAAALAAAEATAAAAAGDDMPVDTQSLDSAGTETCTDDDANAGERADVDVDGEFGVATVGAWPERDSGGVQRRCAFPGCARDFASASALRDHERSHRVSPGLPLCAACVPARSSADKAEFGQTAIAVGRLRRARSARWRCICGASMRRT